MEIGGVFGPSKDGEGEKARGEPSIEDIRILFDGNIGGRDIGMGGDGSGKGLFSCPSDDPFVFLQNSFDHRSEGWNSMSPPQLS